MKLEVEKFEKALALCPDLPGRRPEPVSSRIQDFLNHSAIPDELRQLLLAQSFTSGRSVGKVRLCRVNSLDEENADDDRPSYPDSGFLVVGSAANGDPVAIELSSGRTGYLSHDLLWESPESEVCSAFAAVADSAGEFFLQAVTKEDFPCDYYRACGPIRRDVG